MSAFSSAPWVAFRPCGAPLTTARRAPGIMAADNWPRHLERHDLVAVAVDDQRRHVECRQVCPEVRAPEGDDALLGAERRRGPGDGLGEGHRIVTRHARARCPVEEVLHERLEEPDAILRDAREHAVEDAPVHAAGVVGRLQQEWRHGADQDRLAHPPRAIPADVAGDFTSAHRESRQRHVLKVEGGQEVVQVRGERVVVEPASGTTGVTEPATVVRNAAEAGRDQGIDLAFPHAVTQRPSVDQDDGGACVRCPRSRSRSTGWRWR